MYGMDGSFVTFTGLSALFVFGASQLWDLTREHRKSQRATQSYIRALFAEIDFNTTDLRRFNNAAIDYSDLLNAFEGNKSLVPHITDARHTVVYSDSLSRLSDLPDGFIRDVVEFYGDLEKIREIIAGLDKSSFQTISARGKLNVIKRLYGRTVEAENLGLALLDRFCDEFCELGLRCKHQPEDTRPLNDRLAELESNLDRVRVRHDRPR